MHAYNENGRYKQPIPSYIYWHNTQFTECSAWNVCNSGMWPGRNLNIFTTVICRSSHEPILYTTYYNLEHFSKSYLHITISNIELHIHGESFVSWFQSSARTLRRTSSQYTHRPQGVLSSAKTGHWPFESVLFLVAMLKCSEATAFPSSLSQSLESPLTNGNDKKTWHDVFKLPAVSNPPYQR